MEIVTLRIEGEPEVPGMRQIFKENPHTTWDNFFTGDQIFNWLGEKGFGGGHDLLARPDNRRSGEGVSACEEERLWCTVESR